MKIWISQDALLAKIFTTIKGARKQWWNFYSNECSCNLKKHSENEDKLWGMLQITKERKAVYEIVSQILIAYEVWFLACCDSTKIEIRRWTCLKIKTHKTNYVCKSSSST